MARGRKLFLGLWAICLILGGSRAGIGADWVVLPAVELKGQYLSNTNNSPTNRESDYIASARPSLSMSYNSEITKFEGKLALMGLHYFQNSGLDRINQYYWLNGSYMATPRLSLNLGTSFISDSTASEELLASGTVITRQLRNAFSVNPGLSYSLTERLSTSLFYGFYLVNYQSGDYNNYNSHSVTQGFNYLLNEKVTLLSRISGSYAKYDRGNTIVSLGPQIGFNYKYLEKIDITFLGGLSINRQKSNIAVQSANNDLGFVDQAQSEQTNTNISPFFSLGTYYRWNTGGLSFNYVRSQGANAFGNQSQYNNFNFNVTQSLTNRLSFSVTPYFYTSTIDQANSDYNSYYYGIRPGLSYQLTERTTVGANYGFAYRTVTGATNYSYPINDVWITLNYSYPLHY